MDTTNLPFARGKFLVRCNKNVAAAPWALDKKHLRPNAAPNGEFNVDELV